MLNILKFLRGLKIVPKSGTSEADSAGEMEVLSSDNKVRYHNGSSSSPIVTEAHTATLTNKTLTSPVINTPTGITKSDVGLGNVDNTSDATKNAATATLTNKTLTSPVINSPTGLVKADVGLGNVDNTSDATKNSASATLTNKTIDGDDNTIQDVSLTSLKTVLADADKFVVRDASGIPVSNTKAVPVGVVVGTTDTQTLTNKTLTSPAITTPTGIVKGDVGLGNVDNTSDATKNAAAVTLTNKTLTAPVLNSPSIVTPSRADVKQDTKANLLTYAATATNGQLVFATDEKSMYQVVDNALVSVGGGGQSLDTIFQLDCEEELTDWSTGDNATFLGGGTLSGTFVKETSTPLNGDASYKYTQAAGSLNDYLASPAQDVPVRFRGTTATLYFPFNYNGSTNDIEVLVYDATNAALIPSSVYISNTTNSIFKTNIVIPSTCASIRVGFHVKVLNSGKILNFDDIQLTSDTSVYANIEDYQSVNISQAQSSMTALTNGIRYNLSTATQTNTATSTLFTVTDDGTYTRITAVKNININISARASIGTANNNLTVVKNGSTNIMASDVAYSTNTTVHVGTEFRLTAGEYVYISSTSALNSSASVCMVQVAAKAVTDNVLVTPETFTTDVAPLVYASSSTYTLTTLANAPIGTFITFTLASGGSVRTQTTTAPTQTTASMNTNGIQLFTRARNANSTAGDPACIAIQIGKGLKGVALGLYKSTSKTTVGTLDDVILDSATQYGAMFKEYDEKTGILLVDAGSCWLSTNTSHGFSFSDFTQQTNGYLVINASKNPALVGINNNLKVAILSDVKSSGTEGGTATSGSYQTRTLNTSVDPHGIIVSLASNQFTLAPGRYSVNAAAPTFVTNQSKLKIRNTTDSTDEIIGVAQSAASTDSTTCMLYLEGILTISGSSNKTFELQHRVTTTRATDGWGRACGFGDSEVYAVVKITKLS